MEVSADAELLNNAPSASAPNPMPDCFNNCLRLSPSPLIKG